MRLNPKVRKELMDIAREIQAAREAVSTDTDHKDLVKNLLAVAAERLRSMIYNGV